jgi:hypothetical protein
MTTDTTNSSTSPSTAPALDVRLRPAIGWLLGAGLALAMNLTVLLLANLSMDGSVQVAQPGGEAETLAVLAVVAASIVPLGVGALFLAVLARVTGAARGLRLWSIVVAAVAVISIAGPLTLPVTLGSMVALTAMHLSTGAAAIVGQRLAAHR